MFRLVDNDIALLELETAAECSDKVRAVCISDTEPSDGQMTTVSGWGTLEWQGNLSKKLMKVHVPIVQRNQCNNWYNGGITDNMICAGLEAGGKDSCQGDSGGPLVLKGSNQLVGIVSWGGVCAAQQKPGVYTNVANYVTWIRNECDNCF